MAPTALRGKRAGCLQDSEQPRPTGPARLSGKRLLASGGGRSQSAAWASTGSRLSVSPPALCIKFCEVMTLCPEATPKPHRKSLWAAPFPAAPPSVRVSGADCA
ncbi:hypothetical protein VULLAG_LOCUS3338 [Vulpes lagopus]